MDIEKFIESRPYLYHLTDSNNVEHILTEGALVCCNTIIGRTNLTNIEKACISKRKRVDHVKVHVNKREISIRDQKPITNALGRSLTHGWTVEQFLCYLNDHVYFWPSVALLKRHYKRYVDENPVILRLPTAQVVQVNNSAPLFSFCNSGATRCVSHYGGNPAPRGPNTFVPAEQFERVPSKVIEVTYNGSCELPNDVCLSSNPDGNWVAV